MLRVGDILNREPQESLPTVSRRRGGRRAKHAQPSLRGHERQHSKRSEAEATTRPMLAPPREVAAVLAGHPLCRHGRAVRLDEKTVDASSDGHHRERVGHERDPLGPVACPHAHGASDTARRGLPPKKMNVAATMQEFERDTDVVARDVVTERPDRRTTCSRPGGSDTERGTEGGRTAAPEDHDAHAGISWIARETTDEAGMVEALEVGVEARRREIKQCGDLLEAERLVACEGAKQLDLPGVCLWKERGLKHRCEKETRGLRAPRRPGAGPAPGRRGGRP